MAALVARATKPPVEKVGVLLSLLLLFAGPAFYVLLWLKPFSRVARIGWGLWVGLIVFTSISGLAEPVIPIREMMREAGYPEEDIPEETSLEAYLTRLEGGPLGILIAEHKEDGDTITLRFHASESYFDGDEAIAQIGIGSGYSLLYGRGFDKAVFQIPYRGQTLVMRVERSGLRDFFGLSEEEMHALGQSNERFNASPMKSPPPEELRSFFHAFTHFE